MDKEKPKVSIVIPTLNSASVLETCLRSVRNQKYPKEKIEIIISDGGSGDQTLEIAARFGAKIVENKLKTGEAGKAAGVKSSTGEYIALIDSDNELPDENWLEQMIFPLHKHPKAVGSEPLSYKYRKEDGFIDRYCALMGLNDPFVYFLGKYDRMNILSGRWTEVPCEKKDFDNYILVRFDKRGLPTIGANGTVFRRQFLLGNLKKKHAKDTSCIKAVQKSKTFSKESFEKFGDYLFDIDILAKEIKISGFVHFIKVKNGIVHKYCGSDIKKFAKKQKRRVKDFLYHKFYAKDREYNWEAKDALGTGKVKNENSVYQVPALFLTSIKNNFGMLKFLISCVTVVPLFWQAFKGYSKKPDTAWFFHPVACEITLWEYAIGTLTGMLKKEEISRSGWKQ